MRALVSDGKGAIVLREVPPPTPSASEALIRVCASSINRGEVRLIDSRPGIPGLDVAGIVERAADDGTGFPAGTPVLGFSGRALGGWAERVALTAASVARLPDAIGMGVGAALPTVGLTALHALRVAGKEARGRVLVTGATGSVARMILDMVRATGNKRPTASVSSAERAAHFPSLSIVDVVVGEATEGRFDAIFDGLGGRSLSHAMSVVADGGIVVIYGGQQGFDAPAEPAVIPSGWFVQHPGARLYALDVVRELALGNSSQADLAYILDLVERGAITPTIFRQCGIEDAASMIAHVRNRSAPGKIILRIDGEGGCDKLA